MYELSVYSYYLLCIYETVPSGVPLNVAAVAVDSRTISVTWNPPQADQQNGIIQHYTVTLMVQQTRRTVSINATGLSLTIPNLHPAYDHTIRVVAVTVGAGPSSTTVAVTTPDDGNLCFLFINCAFLQNTVLSTISEIVSASQLHTLSLHSVYSTYWDTSQCDCSFC